MALQINTNPTNFVDGVSSNGFPCLVESDLSLGTMATQNANNVNIVGGIITGLENITVGGIDYNQSVALDPLEGVEFANPVETSPEVFEWRTNRIQWTVNEEQTWQLPSDLPVETTNIITTNSNGTGPIQTQLNYTPFLPISLGGTGAQTESNARAAILPSFTGNANNVLAVNGSATDVEYITTSNWNSVYSSFNTNSGSFLTVETDPVFSAWEALNGNNLIETFTEFSEQSGNNNSVYTTVNTNSSSWLGGGDGEADTFVYNNSAFLIEVDTVVQHSSGDWNSVYTTFNSNSSDFITTETDPVFSAWQTANETSISETITTFASQSAHNASVYTTVNSGSATWSGGSPVGYTLIGGSNMVNPVDSVNQFFGSYFANSITPGTIGTVKMFVPKSGTVKSVIVSGYAASTIGSAEDWKMQLDVNSTTQTTIATVSTTGNRQRTWSNTSMNVAVNAGDFIEIRSVNPVWATNPTNVRFWLVVYIE